MKEALVLPRVLTASLMYPNMSSSLTAALTSRLSISTVILTSPERRDEKARKNGEK